MSGPKRLPNIPCFEKCGDAILYHCLTHDQREKLNFIQRVLENVPEHQHTWLIFIQQLSEYHQSCCNLISMLPDHIHKWLNSIQGASPVYLSITFIMAIYYITFIQETFYLTTRLVLY